MRRGSPAGSRDGSAPTSCWMASISREDDHAGIRGHGEHGDHQRAAHREGLGPRAEERHDDQHHEEQDAAAVGDVVEARQHGAEGEAGQGAAALGVGRLQCLEDRRRDHGPEDRHAPEPYGQREDIDEPQREHAPLWSADGLTRLRQLLGKSGRAISWRACQRCRRSWAICSANPEPSEMCSRRLAGDTTLAFARSTPLAWRSRSMYCT